MRYGVTMFATDVSIGIVDLAKAVEERGLDSVWLPEHTHIPTSRRTPYPAGGELPDEYRRCLDPFVALTAAAMAAPRLRVGTGILLVAQHDPIVAAKAAATLDLVSGGRLALGIGFGWNEDEMNDHGVEYRTRRAKGTRARPRHARAVDADEASFDGEYVRVRLRHGSGRSRCNATDRRSSSAARPDRSCSSTSPNTATAGSRSAVAASPTRSPSCVKSSRRTDATRTSCEIVPFGSIPDPGKLDHFESIGVTECVFQLPSAPADQVLPLLDKQAAIVAERRA